MMESRTVETRHAPVRYLTGGSGSPLVFLHGAGGMTPEDPLVAALGLKDPILVGHSMGGMIAAEMAAVAPGEVSRLALIAPAGLWLADHPIPDMFSLLPFEMPAYLFHDPEAG